MERYFTNCCCVDSRVCTRAWCPECPKERGRRLSAFTPRPARRMEKWMNVQHNNIERRHLSPRNHDNNESARPLRSPPASPIKHYHIPPDPRKWTADNVGRWLEAMEIKHALTVDRSDFRMNGRALCLMNREGFLNRVPDKGAILYEDFRTRLRRYMSACRRRVRTTFVAPGTLGQHMPPPPPPTIGPQGELHQRPPMVPVGLPPPLIRPLAGNLPPDQKLSTVGGAVGGPTVGLPAAAAAAPRLNGPSHLHQSLSNQGLPHRKPAGASPLQLPLSAHGAWQQLSVGSSSRLPPPPSTSTTSHPALPDGNLNPLYFAYPRIYPFIQTPGAQENVQPILTNNVSMQRSMQEPYRASNSLHTAPSSSHTAPSAPTLSNQIASSALTQSSAVSSSCPVHGIISSAGSLHPAPYPYVPRQPSMHSPFYQFVPLYRSMKVVGQFQPITYGYRFANAHAPSLPPASIASGQEDVRPRSPTHEQLRLRSPTPVPESDMPSSRLTPDDSEQSQALDLSMPSKNARSASCSRPGLGDETIEMRNERKRLKVEPSSL